MVLYNEEHTTPSVGDNLLEKTAVRISNRNRVIMKLAYTGGSAIADGEVEIYVGSTKVANLRNNATTTNYVENDNIWAAGQIFVPRGVQVSAVVTVAAAANYNLLIDFKDM